MKRILQQLLLWCVACLAGHEANGVIVFSTYSAYHHIEVVDEAGLRTLSFNGSMETRMLKARPLEGHFEYTEYFHMPWLWNTNIRHVLMIGLGGGSTQRAYQHYYTNVLVDTVEIDPAVVNVAKTFFHVTESSRHRIHVNDGRLFLRRATRVYDVILIDAYTTGRYGSSIPPHLTTREFFTITQRRLGTNGVLCYNIIGEVNGLNADLIGSLYRTLRQVFPQVYLFPARESRNVVLLATRSAEAFDAARVAKEGNGLIERGAIHVPDFAARLKQFVNTPPASISRSPVLTDDHARVEGLMR